MYWPIGVDYSHQNVEVINKLKYLVVKVSNVILVTSSLEDMGSRYM